MSYLLTICKACPLATCKGKCRCKLTGRVVDEQAEAGHCPDDRFRFRGLGDVAAWLLETLRVAALTKRAIADIRQFNAWLAPDGVTVKPGCGCEKRRAALNRLVPLGRA